MTLASAYTAAELALLERMRAERATVGAIAKALGRSKTSVRQRLNRLELRKLYAHTASMGRPVRADPRAVAERADPRAVAERECRLAIAPRDLTAALLGDPLPGYSALDRRRAGVPR